MNVKAYSQMVALLAVTFPCAWPKVERFLEYWEYFSDRSGTWTNETYYYDNSIEFSIDNIVARFAEFRDYIDDECAFNND